MRTAVQLAPFNADAWNQLGFAYRNVENYNNRRVPMTGLCR